MKFLKTKEIQLELLLT